MNAYTAYKCSRAYDLERALRELAVPRGVAEVPVGVREVREERVVHAVGAEGPLLRRERALQQVPGLGGEELKFLKCIN